MQRKVGRKYMADNSLNIELNPGRAIHLQIAEHVRMQLALQRLCVGDRLPAAKALARELKVAPDTVKRAYHKLNREGVVVARGSRGTIIVPPVSS
jgi:GntR family transcriptional regulator/MocR family aminotransferase